MLGAIGLIVAFGATAAMVIFKKRGNRKKEQASESTMTTEDLAKKGLVVEGSAPVSTPVGHNISVGNVDLDTVLAGGLPVGFAVLMVSPPCDERDLLFRNIIESTLAMKGQVFFLSRELAKTEDFATRYEKGFYVFSPQADMIHNRTGNIFKIQNVENLYDLNISFAKVVDTLPKAESVKLIIIDFLSDILLQHRALITRKWLDGFIAKRKGEGFTILGVLNPLMAPEQETQAIMDMFDGIIEINEKDMKERTRRFFIVKKMYGRNYIETEVMLDKSRLL
jgi:archaellum biogenesis ATPase FlaH